MTDNGNSWFKSSNKKYDSISFQNALKSKSYAAIVMRDYIFSLISKYENRDDGLPGYIRVSPAVIRADWGINERGLKTIFNQVQDQFNDEIWIIWGKLDPQKTDTYVQSLRQVSDKFQACFNEVSDKFVQFYSPNWLKSQETRGRKSDQKVEKRQDRTKNNVCMYVCKKLNNYKSKEEVEQLILDASFSELGLGIKLNHASLLEKLGKFVRPEMGPEHVKWFISYYPKYRRAYTKEVKNETGMFVSAFTAYLNGDDKVVTHFKKMHGLLEEPEKEKVVIPFKTKENTLTHVDHTQQ